jgi:hypothetical protein
MNSSEGKQGLLKRSTMAVAIGGVCAFSGATWADLPTLPASGTVGVSGTTVAAHPFLAGTVLVDTLQNWSDGLGDSGQVQTRVVSETGTGTLDFYYRFYTGSGPNPVEALRVTDYTGINPISVDFRTDGVGIVGPDTVKRVGTAGEQGVNFIFSNGFTLSSNFNDNSYFMLVHTDATTYAVATADVLTITHGVTGAPIENLSNAFNVYAPVPEPENYAMLLAGLGLFGLARRRAR